MFKKDQLANMESTIEALQESVPGLKGMVELLAIDIETENWDNAHEVLKQIMAGMRPLHDALVYLQDFKTRERNSLN